MSTAPIKVLIVDDHPVVRDGLALMLSVSPGLDCVGQAGNGEEALRLCAELEPDVILMDLMMPQMDGVAATRLIRQRFDGIQVVALTTFDDKELVQEALRAGAISYLLKNSPMEMITNTIRDASIGKSSISAAVIQSLVKAQDATVPGQELSAREVEVLRLVAEGHTNAAIAASLFISEATVRFHISNIFQKIGAANRAQAVRIALDKGLID